MVDIGKWHQDILNEKLSSAVRANDILKVKEILEQGADIHAWDGYMLTIALGRDDKWEEGSMVQVLSLAMLGATGITILGMLKNMGYEGRELIMAAREACLNQATSPIFENFIPSDML